MSRSEEMKMNKLLVVCLALSLMLLAGAASAAEEHRGLAGRASAAGDLFVLTAAGGRLERLPGARSDFRLVLRAPARNVTVFSDRPARKVGKRSVTGFVQSWRRFGFGRVPPNAALVIDDAPAGRDVAVFELTSPGLGRGARTLTFRAKSLGRRPTRLLHRLGLKADGPAAGSFGRASLFVDSAGDPDPVNLVFTLQNLPHSSGAGLFFSNAAIARPTSADTDGPATVFFAANGWGLTAKASTLNGKVQLNVEPNAGATALKGTANVAGGSVTVAVGNGKPQAITTGSFSISLG
jgi:hypothetical protein